MDPPAYTWTTSPTAKGVVPACVRNPSSRAPRCPAHTIEHSKTTRPPLAHPTPGRTRTHTYLHPRFRLHPSNAISYTHVRYVTHLIAQETFICLIHAVVDEPGKPIYHLTTSLSQTTFHRCLSNPGIFSLHVYSILQGFTANILIFLIMHVLQDSGILKACLLAAVHWIKCLAPTLCDRLCLRNRVIEFRLREYVNDFDGTVNTAKLNCAIKHRQKFCVYPVPYLVIHAYVCLHFFLAERTRAKFSYYWFHVYSVNQGKTATACDKVLGKIRKFR